MSDDDGGPVRYEVSGGAARITLDSPHNRNAVSTAMVEGLHDALDRAAADDTARVVVLGHTGNTFCAGADLSEASASQGTPAEQAAERTRVFIGLLRAIVALPKPVIAVVDGHVRAGGMGLVGACDVAVAGPESSFALTETRLGLAASMITLTLLPRMTSRSASLYMLGGGRFGPEKAARCGLLTESVSDTGAALEGLLETFGRCSPQGLRENKDLLTADLLERIDARGEDLAARSARLFGTQEALEGMTAFLERRKPWWAESGTADR